MLYTEIEQRDRNTLIAKLRLKYNFSYSDADALFLEYFTKHPEQIELVGSKNCTDVILVTAMIRWINQKASTQSTASSRVPVGNLERI